MGYAKYTEPLAMGPRTSHPRLWFNKDGLLCMNAPLAKVVGLDVDGGGYDVYIDRERQLVGIDVGKNFTYKPGRLGSDKGRQYSLRAVSQALSRAIGRKLAKAEVTFEVDNLPAPLLLQFSYASFAAKESSK